jgi:TRAP-type C4-dicarboxylate transport system substrate-binding protein
MKRNKKFTLVVLTIMLSLFFSVNIAVAKTIRLSMSHIFPASHFVHTRLITPWAADVEKATNGKVKIEIFPGAMLLKPAETYDGVVSGTADIAHGIFGYTRGRFPVMEAFDISGINFGSAAATTMVAVDGVEKFKPKELNDTKLMVINGVGPGCLFSKKKITSLDQLDGMRIRATGSTVRSIEALGAVPVAMPTPDTYEALSKGIVDGNIGPPEMLKGWRQAEVTKYITIMPPAYNAMMYIVMNLEKWNSLPKDVQNAIEKVNAKWHLKTGMIWDEEQKVNGVDYGISKGMELVRLPESEYEKGIAMLEPLLKDYITRMEKKGINGKEIIDFVKTRAAVYSKKYPPGY